MPRIVYIAPYSPYPMTFGGSLHVEPLWRALQAFGPTQLIVLGEMPAQEHRLRLRREGAWLYPPRRETPAGRIARCVKAALTGRCIPAERYMNARRLEKLLARLREHRPDVIVLGDTYLATLCPAMKGLGAKVFVDTLGSESLAHQRMSRAAATLRTRLEFYILYRNTLAVERKFFPQAHQVWVVTDAEAELYRRQLHVRDVRVLPNVLDLSRYQLRLPEEEGAIVYTGLYAYGPNELAAMALIECSRRLRENGVPHHVYLVGRQPTQKMRDAAAGHEQITITGEVADSHPYIARASVLAVPLATGGGTKFKILEAMALGRCVLTTPIGAEGMRLTPGIHAAITGLDEFEPELENLLKDPARRAELAGAGQRFVRENFSTQVLQARLKQCLADAGF